MSTTESPEEKISLRDQIIGCVGAIAVLGACVGGGYVGLGKLAMSSAYARAHVTTLAEMGDAMRTEVTSARSNFILGATSDAEIDIRVRVGHKRYAEDSPVSEAYFAAGQEWQKEARLSDEALNAVAKLILDQNNDLKMAHETGVHQLEQIGLSEWDARSLVSAAMFRGMLDATADVMELDPRTDRRVSKVLEKVKPEEAPILEVVRNTALETLRTEARGNDRLFAHLQNVLNEMPADLASFNIARSARKPFLRKDVGVNENFSASKVEPVDASAEDLNPVFDGLNDEPGM